MSVHVENEILRNFARYMTSEGRSIDLYYGLFGVISKLTDTNTKEEWSRERVLKAYMHLKEHKLNEANKEGV
jgi:hypothetical protein